MPLEFNESVRHKLYLVRIKLSKLPKYKGNILKVSWNDVINHILYQYNQVNTLTSKLIMANSEIERLKNEHENATKVKKPETINLNITLNNPNQNFIAAVDNRHVNVTQQNLSLPPPPPPIHLPPPVKALPPRKRINVKRDEPKTLKEELETAVKKKPSEIWLDTHGECYEAPDEVNYYVELPDRKIYDEYGNLIDPKNHPFNNIRKTDAFDAAEIAKIKEVSEKRATELAEKKKKELLNPLVEAG